MQILVNSAGGRPDDGYTWLTWSDDLGESLDLSRNQNWTDLLKIFGVDKLVNLNTQRILLAQAPDGRCLFAVIRCATNLGKDFEHRPLRASYCWLLDPRCGEEGTYRNGLVGLYRRCEREVETQRGTQLHLPFLIKYIQSVSESPGFVVDFPGLNQLLIDTAAESKIESYPTGIGVIHTWPPVPKRMCEPGKAPGPGNGSKRPWPQSRRIYAAILPVAFIVLLMVLGVPWILDPGGQTANTRTPPITTPRATPPKPPNLRMVRATILSSMIYGVESTTVESGR